MSAEEGTSSSNTMDQTQSTAPPTKVFHDPIHGQMEFDPLLVKIIDTPQFQRLRNLKQLGAAYFVYPGATHSRFEHSLGVAHLAGQLVRHLQKEQPELNIDECDVRCVEIAALCHDLGHGPFSHMFDQMFIPKARPDKATWTHEKGSIDMFDYIVKNLKRDGFHLKLELKNLKKKQNEGNMNEEDDNENDNENQGEDGEDEESEGEESEDEDGEDEDGEDEDGEDLSFIKEMIYGPLTEGQYVGRPLEKSFLYEIVSNKRNGIDVDKLDYFARDFYHLGMKNEFDHRRFIKFARVCEVDGELQICTRDKELENMYEVFHTRHCIHRKVCQHKTLKIIDVMITEALLEADNLKISTAIDDMEKYTGLTDCIFEKILYSADLEPFTPPKPDPVPEPFLGLKKAKNILKNIISRNLFKYLGKTKMKEDFVTEKLKAELANMPTYSGEKLKTADFEIIEINFDFGMQEKNPVENLHFYGKFDKTKGFKIASEQVSQFHLLRNFSGKWIYVYCRSPKKRTQTLANRQFYQWCHKNNFSVPPYLPLQEPSQSQPKVFNDPVHGPMEFHPLLVRIIDTPQFQRLRFVKQLGAASYVYPGASHNTFEHCLGMAHLAGQFVQRLKEKQPELEISDKDVLCVQIAALCRELGYVSFSGESDESFLQNLCPELQWENMSSASGRLFNQIMAQVTLAEYKVGSDTAETLDVTFIREMITGQGRSQTDKKFLYDIVNDKTNGVDVSVMDRVARDCYQLGLKTNFDHQRFIKFARVNNSNPEEPFIWFRDKVMSSLYDLFHTAAALHTEVYQHNVTVKIQHMMSDVIKEQIQHMRERKSEEEIYSELTDGLFGERSSEDAKVIVKDIHSRKLCRSDQLFVSELTMRITEKEQNEEMAVDVSTMHFSTRAGTDPVGRVRFYDKRGNESGLTGKWRHNDPSLHRGTVKEIMEKLDC